MHLNDFRTMGRFGWEFLEVPDSAKVVIEYFPENVFLVDVSEEGSFIFSKDRTQLREFLGLQIGESLEKGLRRILGPRGFEQILG